MSDPVPTHVGRKIEKVVRTSTSSKSDLEFHYDAMGNRICKIVKPRAGSGILTQENWTYTYYLRDAQGNVLATYDRTFRAVGGGFTEKYNLKENDLYGSSRTGIRNTSFEVASVALTTSGYNGDGTINVTAVAAGSGTALSTTIFNHKLGEKSYELTNHLGNVLVTVSDMRTANYSGLVVTGWNAVVNSATDYYAFGSIMPGRNFVSSTSYRYSMNGQEKDEELGIGVTSAEFWEYDGKLGRRWNTDPIITTWESPYAVFNNSPIKVSDPKGKFPYPTGNTNTVNSIVKNENGSYTISEEIQIVSAPVIKEEHEVAVDYAMGRKSVSTTTQQTVTYISSTTTIDANGTIVSNSATKIVRSSTITKIYESNVYTGELISITGGGGVDSPVSNEQGKYIGAFAQTAQATLSNNGKFPVMNDADNVFDTEKPSENVGVLEEAADNMGDPQEKPADKFYEAGQRIMLEDKYTLSVGKQLEAGDFTPGSYDTYNDHIQGASASRFQPNTSPPKSNQ